VYWEYDGEERTYSFVTNGGEAIESITATALTSLPTPVREDYYFDGWYDNEELTGDAISGAYFSKDKTTLYAKWLTDEEYHNGSSFERAKTAESGKTYTVDITTGGQKCYFKFIATESASYTIQSTGSVDTYGHLYNSSQSQITYNDDNGSDRNFKITYQLNEGETYYIVARLYSSNVTGSFSVSFSKE
jgi:uncharacterized repeat protein (TIGR02543 family)